MGKGDRRTRRGKLFRGTFGKHRPRKAKKPQPKSNKK
jgi:30S ribosomal protein S31